MRYFLFAIIFCLSFYCKGQDLNPANEPNLVGYWKFEDRNNLLKATVGNNLQLTGSHSWVKGASYGDTAIRITIGSYYTANHMIKPNGGGTRVNRYTLMYDFKVLSFNKWHTFHQTDTTNLNDGECFIRPNTGSYPARIGVAATQYAPDSLHANTWYRLMISVNNGNYYRYYLNGKLILEGDTQDIDDRFSLATQLLFFADNNQEDDTIDVASIGLWDTCLSTAQIEAIGTIDPCIANPPKPNLGNDTTLCAGASLIKNAGPGHISYLWSTGAKTQNAFLDLSKLKMGMNTVWVRVIDQNGCTGTDTVRITYAPLPQVKLGNDTGICRGNSLWLTAGTDTSIQYTWKHLPSGNILSGNRMLHTDSSGFYTVKVVSDAGCAGYDTIQVKVYPLPSKPVIAKSHNGPVCNGDSIQIGGPPDIWKYFWNGVGGKQFITVKNSGGYRLVVQDILGCVSEASDSLFIAFKNNPVAPVLNSNRDTSICNGDSIALYVMSGYLNYVWQDGPGDSVRWVKNAGNYSVFVVDSFYCQSPVSNKVLVTVLQVPAKPGITSSDVPILCEGDSVDLFVPSGQAAYEWNTGETTARITVSTNGYYRVRVFNTSVCASPWSDSVNVTVHPLPARGVITLKAPDSLVCSVAAEEYLWYRNNIPAGTTKTIRATAGYYRVNIKDAHCWSGLSDSFQFVPNSVRHFNQENITIFPNPTSGNSSFYLNISQTETIESVEVYDLKGRLQALNGQLTATDKNLFSIDLSELNSGNYLIFIRCRDKTYRGVALLVRD